MLFKIICVGKIKEEYYSSQIQELCKQINKKNRVEIIQSEDEKIPKNASDAVKQKIIETESRNSLASIGKNDFVIALYKVKNIQPNNLRQSYVRQKSGNMKQYPF